MIEVGNHGVSKSEVIGWEDEFVSPAVELLQHTVGTYSRFRGTHGTNAHCTDMTSIGFSLVDNLASFCCHHHLLRAHLMLGKVLDLNRIEAAQATVYCNKREVDATDLHTLHQFTAEVQT